MEPILYLRQLHLLVAVKAQPRPMLVMAVQAVVVMTTL
jgi:hypothetical protein